MASASERAEVKTRWFMAPTDDRGRINSSGLAQLLEQIRRAHCRCLILDLRAARALHSYDLKLLVQARDLLRSRKGRLRVVARAGGEVARLLKQHQLDHLFFLHRDPEEAWSGRTSSSGIDPAAS